MDFEAPACPYCQEPAILSSRVTRYRRGQRELPVKTGYWECPSGCEGPDGSMPFCFEDPQLLRANDEKTRAAWLDRFGEPMPPSRRPGRKPAERRSTRVQVRLTPSERLQLDRDRGDASRSAFLRDRALQGARSPAAPGFPLVDRADPNESHREAS